MRVKLPQTNIHALSLGVGGQQYFFMTGCALGIRNYSPYSGVKFSNVIPYFGVPNLRNLKSKFKIDPTLLSAVKMDDRMEYVSVVPFSNK